MKSEIFSLVSGFSKHSVDEINILKCPDNLSEHNGICSAIEIRATISLFDCYNTTTINTKPNNLTTDSVMANQVMRVNQSQTRPASTHPSHLGGVCLPPPRPPPHCSLRRRIESQVSAAAYE